MAFNHGLRLEEGGFLLVGEWRGAPVHWLTNPRLLLPQAWFVVVQMWRLSQGGMGRGWLAEAGGAHDQPAWLLHAWSILNAEDARLDRLKEGSR